MPQSERLRTLWDVFLSSELDRMIIELERDGRLDEVEAVEDVKTTLRRIALK